MVPVALVVLDAVVLAIIWVIAYRSGWKLIGDDSIIMLRAGDVFGPDTPCSSSKGYTGHTLGAAGGVAAVVSMLALQHGLLPAGLNVRQLDPALRTRYLLEALQQFSGTLIMVSHDRHFLRSLVDRVFEIDHGNMQIYEGDYDYYLEQTATC